MVVLDTNVLIYYLKEEKEIVRLLERYVVEEESVAISSLSIVELLGYSHTEPAELYGLERWLRRFIVIEVDTNTAVAAARLRREYHLTTVDSVIAATAQVVGGSVVTRDQEFKKAKEIKVILV